jgi:hypothetical protein
MHSPFYVSVETASTLKTRPAGSLLITAKRTSNLMLHKKFLATGLNAVNVLT